MSEAHFTRSQAPQGFTFDVTPCKPPTLWIVGASIVGFLGLFAGGAGLVVFGLMYWDFRRRKPTRVEVSADGLRVGDDMFPTSDIAELLLQDPRGNQVVSMQPSVTVYDTRGVAGGVMAASSAMANATTRGLAAMADAQARSQMQLKLRRISSSKPVTLMGFLDQETGRALMDDLLRDLEALQPAAEAATPA